MAVQAKSTGSKGKGKGKGSNMRSPSDKSQKYRSFKNTVNQRARHQAKYPNDVTSIKLAKRWIVRPSEAVSKF